MAYPAGVFMKKYGYKNGIILGLNLFATGAFLFYPVAKLVMFVPFLIALFIIALRTGLPGNRCQIHIPPCLVRSRALHAGSI